MDKQPWFRSGGNTVRDVGNKKRLEKAKKGGNNLDPEIQGCLSTLLDGKTNLIPGLHLDRTSDRQMGAKKI